MKNYIKNIVMFLMYIWSHIYTYSSGIRLKWYMNKLYSFWIRNFIGEVGDETKFSFPLYLQGGGQQRIKIGSQTSIGHHTILGCWEQYSQEQYEPEVVIGNYCIIGDFCHITAVNRIIIGDGLLTGRFVYIGDNSHGGLSKEESSIPPVKRKLKSKGEIVIGNNVWIGDKVTILSGVTIGSNVIVGANSVVTHDVPSDCLVVGNPARIVKNIEG